jgi:hypothetical protein
MKLMTLRLAGHGARMRGIRKCKLFTGNADKQRLRKTIKNWGGKC